MALIVLGTTGECATMTSQEYDAFVDCVLATVKKRIPTFIGTTALGTHEVVRRTRFAAERGADGILLGLPMWQPLTVDMAVEYYRQHLRGVSARRASWCTATVAPSVSRFHPSSGVAWSKSPLR